MSVKYLQCRAIIPLINSLHQAFKSKGVIALPVHGHLYTIANLCQCHNYKNTLDLQHRDFWWLNFASVICVICFKVMFLATILTTHVQLFRWIDRQQMFQHTGCIYSVLWNITSHHHIALIHRLGYEEKCCLNVWLPWERSSPKKRVSKRVPILTKYNLSLALKSLWP